MLSEFYKNFSCIGVSSVTGEGFDLLFEALEKAALEYETGYKIDLEQRRAQKEKAEQDRQSQQIQRIKADLNKPISSSALENHKQEKFSSNLNDDMDIDNIKTTADDDDDDVDDDDNDDAQTIDYQNFLKMIDGEKS